MPSTGELTGMVLNALRSRDSRSAPPAEFRRRVEAVVVLAKNYYGDFTFEHLFDLFEAGESLASGWTTGNGPTIAEVCLTQPASSLADVMTPAFFSECSSVVQRTVLDAVVRASSVGMTSNGASDVRQFWTTISDVFALSIVTLNYDDLLEQMLQLGPREQGLEAVDGERVWRLSASSQSTKNENLLLHLHGGIHFGQREYGTEPNRFCYEASFSELYWHPSAATALQSGSSHGGRSQAGRMNDVSAIVTGLYKPDKLLVEPFASYYVRAAYEIASTPRVLVVGYGFADLHINAMLARITRTFGSRRRVAVIDKIDMLMETGSTSRAHLAVMLQQWSREFFEFDGDHPNPWSASDGSVQLYWSGLLDAASNVHAILRFLQS
jgi:hypothetical protein